MAQDGTAGGVNVSGSQGVQVGDGGTLINNWQVKLPFDVRVLTALNPQAALARILQMPHDDAVDLFAGAPAEVLTEILKALLLADEAKAVAILADLNPGKAATIIDPHVDDFFWLYFLPDATESITQRSTELRWNSEPGTGRLERAQRSPEGTDGYFRQYRRGRIYWSDDYLCDDEGATYAVQGPIAEFHLASDGTRGELGFPKGYQYSYESALGTKGTGQAFEGGYVDHSAHGTYHVSPGFSDLGDDWLGYPVSAAEADRNGTLRQKFEGGVICSSESGTFGVRLKVAEHANGWVPVAAEERVGSHPTGRVQRFKNAAGLKMAVYSSEPAGAYPVVGRMLVRYEELGGPGSWLGFPVGKAEGPPACGGLRQGFEHGSIYDQPGHRDPVTVPAETAELTGDRIGWPVSEEQSMGSGGSGRIQFFENGAVIVRDGKREILVNSAELDALRAELDELKRISQLRVQERKTELERLCAQLFGVELALGFLGLNPDKASVRKQMEELRSKLAQIHQGFLSISDLGPVSPSDLLGPDDR
jgi:hypothetical protein